MGRKKKEKKKKERQDARHTSSPAAALKKTTGSPSRPAPSDQRDLSRLSGDWRKFYRLVMDQVSLRQ